MTEQNNFSTEAVYQEVVEQFFCIYDLKRIELNESGFLKGDADDEDFDLLFQRIKEINFDDFTSELPNMERSEVSNDDILEYLDYRFEIMLEEVYDSANAK